jgi:hypothetical protein
MSMIFILIWIKFDIDINNDELLEIIWESFFLKNKLIVIGSAQQCKAQMI